MQLSQAKSLKLIESITCIMHALNDHDKKKMDTEIKKLKKASSNLPLKLKDDIQSFIVQADIQKDYDIGHGVTKKLKQLADKLVSDLKN